jgi:hypothetical protein
VKDEFLFTVDDGVSGVVAALAADDDVGVIGEVIDDFAFAFVAPLGADENSIGHKNLCSAKGCMPRRKTCLFPKNALRRQE